MFNPPDADSYQICGLLRAISPTTIGTIRRRKPSNDPCKQKRLHRRARNRIDGYVPHALLSRLTIRLSPPMPEGSQALACGEICAVDGFLCADLLAGVVNGGIDEARWESHLGIGL